MNKTPEQVDEIMESISPPLFRYRWCGAEAGPCACLGCVQICSRALMWLKNQGTVFQGDPEYINPYLFPDDIREACTITHEEWEAWKVRNPEPADILEQSGYRLHYGGGESFTWKQVGPIDFGGAKGESP